MPRTESNRVATIALALLASATFTGCGAQPRFTSVRLMGASSSPLSVQGGDTSSPQPAYRGGPGSAAISQHLPMLAATCSPAFRWVRVEALTHNEQHVVSAEPEAFTTWEPLPMMMATSSPAFLHRLRATGPQTVAAQDVKADVAQSNAD